jgi:hypothetical protein
MIRDAASQFLEEIAPVTKDAICGHDGIAHYIEQPTVNDILQVILPALGLSLFSTP